MHGPGIIGNKQITTGNHSNQLAELSLSGKNGGGLTHQRTNGFSNANFLRSPKDHHVGTLLFNQAVQQPGIAVAKPTLGRAERSAWINADQLLVRVDAFRSKPVPGCLLPGNTHLQGYVWQRSNFRRVAAWDARRPQGRTRLIQELVDQIEIIVSLMQLNDSRIDRYGMCQQPAASVPAVTCANRNPGEPGQKGGFKGILKKKRGIEMRPPQG